jgi:hypothetical protein
MTEDYKQSLIDYVSGLLKIEAERPTDFDPNEIAGTGVEDYTSQRWSAILSAFDGKSVSINGILESEFYDNYIMYGGYQNGNSGNCNGFLIYVNEYGLPTKARLLSNARGFQFLKFDETNNRVYGVASDRATTSVANDNDAYFVYYNNLFLTESDDNPPDITYSYKIHTDSGTNYFTARDIVKHPEKPFYLIYSTNFSGLNYARVTELKINVGQANELNTLYVNSNYFGYAFYGWYDNETPKFKIIVRTENTTATMKLITYNGSASSETALTNGITLERPQNAYIKDNYLSMNENNIFFVYNANYEENAIQYKKSILLKYDGTTTLKGVYSTSAIAYGTYHDIPILNILRDNNTIYCVRGISDEANGTTHIAVVNISEHSDPQESDFEDLGTGSYIYRFNMYNFRTILRRNYNLLYFENYSGYIRESFGNYDQPINGFSNQVGRIKQRIGYTGYPYSYYNVLVPRYVNLYYASEALMFSRNVYNITRFNNTTTASVEVPSNYLNNYPIGREKLFGNTGYELVRANELISKNQYEVLHLNFLNTINVIDEDTNTMYDLGAIKTNEGITTGTQVSYVNSKCTKYRINYEDNTTLVNTITWKSINDLNKQTNFTIYIDKEVKNIDLISNDESTIYLTINGEFEIGKTYSIYQKVRIGEKPQQENLVYNAQNVLYNGQQIKVYTQ